MIIISDLHESYIQEITVLETATISGGKSEYFPDFNVNINIAIIPIIQLNLLSDYSSNYANANVKF